MSKLGAAVSMFIITCVVIVWSAPQASAEGLRIALIVWRGETPAEAGFREGLKNLGYTAEYVVVNGDQDRRTLRSRFEEMIIPNLDTFDYIYSFGSTASKMTKDLVKGRIPQLFNIVIDPVGAGLVRSLSEPGDNISGASQIVPLEAQIRAALNLFSIKKLGMFFNPREKNSMIQRNQIKRVAEKYGFEVVDLRSPPALETLEKNLQKLADKRIAVDAVYLPFDSFLVSNAALIGSKLREAKIKSIATIKLYIDGGALMGVVPDYPRMGRAVAQVLDRHRKGEELGHIPVQEPYLTEAPILLINEITRAALGLEIPEAVLSKAVTVK